MQVSVKCEKCGFKISSEMKAAIEAGKCPSCGADFAAGDISSVFLFIDTITELNLPLTAGDIGKFIDVFLKQKLNLEFPPLHIQENAASKFGKALKQGVRSAQQVPSREPIRPAKPTIPAVTVETDGEQDEQDEQDDLNEDYDDDEGLVINKNKMTKEERDILNGLNKPLAQPPHPKKFFKPDGEAEQGIQFLSAEDFSGRGIDPAADARERAASITAQAKAAAAIPKPKSGV